MVISQLQSEPAPFVPFIRFEVDLVYREVQNDECRDITKGAKVSKYSLVPGGDVDKVTINLQGKQRW